MTRAEAIIRDVCRERKIGIRSVLGRRGTPRDELVSARAEIVKRIRETTRLSLPQIGAALGGRHHTTILHYLRKEAA